jgi:hypothetical protein
LPGGVILRRGRGSTTKGITNRSSRSKSSKRSRRLSISVSWIPRSLLPKTYSQTSKSPSFPHAFSGNPDESLTGPPIKTFGGDNCGRNSYTNLILRSTGVVYQLELSDVRCLLSQLSIRDSGRYFLRIKSFCIKISHSANFFSASSREYFSSM